MALAWNGDTQITFTGPVDKGDLDGGSSVTSLEWTWPSGSVAAVIDVYITKDGAWTPADGDLITVGLLKTLGDVDNAGGDEWPDGTDKSLLVNVEQHDMVDANSHMLRIHVDAPVGQAKLVGFNDAGASDNVDIYAQYNALVSS